MSSPKRLFWSHFSTAAFLLALLPVSIFAQFACITNNGTITITGYTGPGSDVAIPATIDGLSVTGIGSNALNNVRISRLEFKL